jgi:hypothetical protein
VAGGGCRFEWTGEVSEGAPVVDHELAFDPSTCQSLRERGRLVSRGSGKRAGASSKRVGGLPSPHAGGGARAASTTRWHARIESLWEHPPQIDVTKVENHVIWEPDGSGAFEAEFRNDSFCVVDPTTWTRHAQYINGDPAGNSTYGLGMYKDGGCGFLLSSDFSSYKERDLWQRIG